MDFSVAIDELLKLIKLPFTLRDQQLRVLENVYTKRSTIFIAPCGSGKSIKFGISPLLNDLVNIFFTHAGFKSGPKFSYILFYELNVPNNIIYILLYT